MPHRPTKQIKKEKGKKKKSRGARTRGDVISTGPKGVQLGVGDTRSRTAEFLRGSIEQTLRR